MNNTEKHLFLANLLHISDPTLPIGGYIHSNGLETFVQREIVRNNKTAKEFVENMLCYNLKYNDGAFFKIVYQATLDNNLEKILEIDQVCNALKAPREIRQASQKLGLRLIKIFKRHISSELVEHYEAEISKGNAFSHYSVSFGMYAALLKIPLYDALFGFYYSSISGMITNAVKLVPLGQLDGQDILFGMYPILEKITQETIDLDEEYIGLCNTSFDIRCMQHERLYSRLYMS